jgi:hypothetical protein
MAPPRGTVRLDQDTVQFRNMKDHFNTPESKEALRQEILEAVPVTEIPPERIYGRPPIPLRLLTNPDVHSAFLDGEWRMTELTGLGPLEVAALRSVSATTGPSLPAIPDESPGPTGTRIVLHARADADLDSPVIGPNIPLTCAQKNAWTSRVGVRPWFSRQTQPASVTRNRSRPS